MLFTVIFYTALISRVLSTNGAEDKQLDVIVKLLENQFGNAKLSASDESNENDDLNNIVGQMNTADAINLIQDYNENKQPIIEYNKRQKKRGKSNSLKRLHSKSLYDPNKNNKVNYEVRDVLEQLLKEERQSTKKKKHQALTPNRLLPQSQYKYDVEIREPKSGLSDFSKIFVVLDPIALQKSKNTGNLPNLLSRILQETSSVMDKTRQDRSKHQRYKGFIVKKDSSKSRRFRRESKESYGGGGGGGGGDDDDYRPKRQRNDHNAGGGGGRTAIPYIRHRGDIYERDH